MKDFFIKNTNFIPEDVSYLQDFYGFDYDLACLFSSRGVTADNADRYFEFSEDNFYDPFLMSGMEEAVSVIRQVIKDKGSILVYGDYDADGLTASALLKLYFDSINIDCDIVVPTREKGYGMHVDIIEKAFEKKPYHLILTVDCGISNKDEIEHLKKNIGAYIIVTDHHEVPSILPDCICVNPKLGYPYPFLSGAGVALKLVQALAGLQKAKKYAALAMIGTVADMMPLVDENRDITIWGLKNFRHAGLECLAQFSNCAKPFTASDIGLRIAPKINAAGRIGDPLCALKLLLMHDKVDEQAVQQLLEINNERKELVTRTVSEAQAKLDTVRSVSRGLIFLHDDNWKTGILGIVANRFKESYGVTSVICAKEGDYYVGSARGAGDINLFTLFDSVSDILVRFGGHKSSLGFSVLPENLSMLEERLSAQLESHSPIEDNSIVTYDLDFDIKYLVHENLDFLDIMEPLLPNDKPVFYAKDYAKSVMLFGTDKNHIKLILNSGLELKGFYSYADYYEALSSGALFEVLFTLEYDAFSKKVMGTITSLRLKNSLHFDEIYLKNLISRISYDLPDSIDDEQLKAVLSSKSVIAVFSSYYEFEEMSKKIDFSDFSVFYFSMQNFAPKAVIISPIDDSIFSRYAKKVAFGTDFGCFAKYTDNCYFYRLKRADNPKYLQVKVDRDVCAAVYKALKTEVRATDLRALYNKLRFKEISYLQFYTSVKIFEELGLIELREPFDYKLIHDKKRELVESKIFRLFNKVDKTM